MQIFYTGVGSNTSGEHSISEFLDIMYSQFTTRTWTSFEREYYYTIPALKFRRYKLPEDFIHFTIQDWIDYSGATVLYSRNDSTCINCGKMLFIQNGECVNCENIRFINLHCSEIFDLEEYTDSCQYYYSKIIIQGSQEP